MVVIEHTGTVLKKFVTEMVFAMLLVSLDSSVIWSMLDCIIEALTWALAAAARARTEAIGANRILSKVDKR